MARTGIYDVAALWETRFAGAKDIGQNTIREVLEFDLRLHNANVNGLYAELVMDTISARDVIGSSTHIRGKIVDEYSRAETQITTPGSEVGYPLHKLQYPTSYTEMWLANRDPEEILVAQESVQKGNLLDIQMLIKQAIYNSANRSVRDINKDNVTVNIKAFWNQDGEEIPDSPNSGLKFDGSTHDHYLATAAFDVTNARQLIDTVAEHGASPRVRVYINQSDIPAWTGLGDFHQNPYSYMVYNASDIPGTTRSPEDIGDFHLGWLDAAQVWVKPWAVASYPFAFDVNQSASLKRRVHDRGYLNGLTLKTPNTDINPLQVDHYEQLIGFGVFNRSNGAVLYTGGGSYVDPVIT